MSKRLTTSEFKDRLENIYGNQFELLSEYINNETKVKLKCNKCNSIIYKRPSKMTGSTTKEGCYVCSGKNHYKTTESFKLEVDEKFPDTYKVLGKYKRAREKIRIKRIICGHIYYITPDNLLRGKGCPLCSIKQSHYMDLVEEILDSYNIKYIKEKTFDDCRNIRPLPFDYYIEDFNVCIEVDGEFHYRTSYNSKHNKIEEIQKRDNIKTQYCIDKGIKLIRLPYFEEQNFKSILEKELYVDTEIT